MGAMGAWGGRVRVRKVAARVEEGSKMGDEDDGASAAAARVDSASGAVRNGSGRGCSTTMRRRA